MSSFNNVTKIKYTARAGELVELKEYILFEDERAEEKYVVFKFLNNVNQQLLGFEFEVNEYDADGALIEKTVAVYNQFSAKPQQAFVPKAKLKVNYACRTLSVKLRKAAFDRFIWKDGEYEDNSYKFSHYVMDEEVENKLKELEELKLKADKKPRKEKKKKREPEEEEREYKPYFKVKNKTRQNIPVFPAVFGVFVCLLAVAYVAVTLALFMQSSRRFTLEGYDLRIISGIEVSIYGYEGEDTKLEIPEYIESFKVTKIEAGAFKNCKMETVTLAMSNITIESYAFENCANLKLVTASSSTRLVMYEDSFVNCHPALAFYAANRVVYPAPDER